MEKLTGRLSPMPTLNGNLSIESELHGSLTVGDIHMDGGYDFYSGEYEVLPKANENTILPTKNKILEENVIVLDIPYYEVSNVDGITIYIGKDE